MKTEKPTERPNNFGDAVKRLRLARDWTLPQLAQYSGLSKGLLSKLENAGEECNPTLVTIRKIAKAYGLSVASMIWLTKDGLTEANTNP